ncbi:MAG: hypothetical protein C5B53_02960 [Candidatus Melainabacteria bacterium]|nr:MAG: hypothetical protein C5B53_02960 [Candidatus Melainabacteria bacterium]
MNIFSRFTMAAMGMSLLATLALTVPAAHAGNGVFGGPSGSTALSGPAGPGDAFGSGDTGFQAGENDPTAAAPGYTGTQATNDKHFQTAPALQGATNGTIGPQMDDATYVTGVNTAGTVRVNNLANLEALLNIIANGMEILAIAWGGPTMIMGFMHMAAGTQDSMKRVLFGAAGVTGGLATPGCINWLVASARDANLFS